MFASRKSELFFSCITWNMQHFYVKQSISYQQNLVKRIAKWVLDQESGNSFARLQQYSSRNVSLILWALVSGTKDQLGHLSFYSASFSAWNQSSVLAKRDSLLLKVLSNSKPLREHQPCSTHINFIVMTFHTFLQTSR